MALREAPAAGPLEASAEASTEAGAEAAGHENHRREHTSHVSDSAGDTVIKREVDSLAEPAAAASYFAGLLRQYETVSGQDEDALVSKRLVYFCARRSLAPEQSLQLIQLMTQHAVHPSLPVRDRVAMVAAALFRTDDLAMTEKSCYASFVPFLPPEVLGRAPPGTAHQHPTKPNPFDTNQCVPVCQQLLAAAGSPEEPLFLQDALRLLRQRDQPVGPCLRALPRILGRTTDRTVRRYSLGLLSELVQPVSASFAGWEDQQILALASLLARDIDCYRGAVDLFFDTTAESRQFLLLASFTRLIDLVDPGRRVLVHLLFAEALLSREPAPFSAVVSPVLKHFLEKGLSLTAAQPDSRQCGGHGC